MVLLLALVLAAPSQKFAVLEFESQLPPADARQLDRVYFSDQVRGALRHEIPDATVMTRENTFKLLQSFGKKLEDCVGECEVETGKMLGADYVVSGRLTKIGTRFKLTLRMHRTDDGTLVSSSTSSGNDANQLDDNTPAAVTELLAPVRPQKPPSRPDEPSPEPRNAASGPTRPSPEGRGPQAAQPSAPAGPDPHDYTFAIRAGLGGTNGYIGLGLEYRPVAALGIAAYAGLGAGLSLVLHVPQTGLFLEGGFAKHLFGSLTLDDSGTWIPISAGWEFVWGHVGLRVGGGTLLVTSGNTGATSVTLMGELSVGLLF